MTVEVEKKHWGLGAENQNGPTSFVLCQWLIVHLGEPFYYWQEELIAIKAAALECARLAEKALKTHVETTEVSEKIYSYVVFCSYQLKGNLKLIRELEGELARYKEKHQAARGAKRALRHAGPMIRLLVHWSWSFLSIIDLSKSGSPSKWSAKRKAPGEYMRHYLIFCHSTLNLLLDGRCFRPSPEGTGWRGGTKWPKQAWGRWGGNWRPRE